MNGVVWPFAVTRSRGHGYRTVIAPRALIGAGATSVLSEGTVDDIGPHARVRKVTGADGAELWLVYRVSVLSESDVGAEGAPVLDRYGRPVRLTEGVVVGAKPTGGVTEALFAKVRERTRQALGDFWQADDLA
ncbi:hypothetical protein EDD29_7471 [Actinocorallia herbida]|uniref:Uncharacterized protein n=1 Tax=Actinocorallia herbida TaxID=58109 RepID=A0A3N1D893_9ACTN|nr:hypothetical protein [Actinocorallia herbida]ROO89763.1 hypothetical protein EDD29_7471 [Actinocorallia herbida]